MSTPERVGLEWKYLLRWRFDYINKPSKAGLWMQHGPNPSDQAWCQSREGLLYARVEGKHLQDRTVSILAECPAADFCLFQWNAAQITGPKFQPIGGPIIVGIHLVTRYFDILVLADGSVKMNPRSEQEQKFHYETYGQ